MILKRLLSKWREAKPDKQAYMRLCTDAWQRGQRPVRLIGLGLQFNPPDIPEQLELNY